MNDENEDSEFINVPLEDLPKPLRDRVEGAAYAYDRHLLAQEVRVADIFRFIRELPSEHRSTLGHLLDSVIESRKTGTYIRGYIDALQREVHGVCVTCGVDHDRESLEAMKDRRHE